MEEFERKFVVDESGIAEEKPLTEEERKKLSSHPKQKLERKFIVGEDGVAEEKLTKHGLEKRAEEQIKDIKKKRKELGLDI